MLIFTSVIRVINYSIYHLVYSDLRHCENQCLSRFLVLTQIFVAR